MHPLEHFLYFSVSMIHWVLPSSPIHLIFNLQHAGLSPAIWHSGFDKFVTQEERGLKNRFFTVNFWNEAVPLDQWFGTWHDGSPEGQARMMAR